MVLKKWNDLPSGIRNDAVKPYYDILSKRICHLLIKRLFDVVAGIIVLLLSIPLMIAIGILIKVDSKGPILFRQARLTQYGKQFQIVKFRTMSVHTENKGPLISIKDDCRITRIGHMLRKFRLDELPQLFNIINGNMSFVGTRPEIPKYVAAYTNEMMATLLLPAGVTSEASIMYRDEHRLLNGADDVDTVYIKRILPKKMAYNLDSLRGFSFSIELLIMVKTVMAVFGLLGRRNKENIRA